VTCLNRGAARERTSLAPIFHDLADRIPRRGILVVLSDLFDEVPDVLAGLGTSILTTSRGVMTGREAVKVGVGGEVLCNVW
jgi:small subunit ribosomal protein S8